MINKIYTLVFISILLTSAFGYAQASRTYKSLAKDNSTNYNQIVRQARTEFSNEDLSKIENKKAKKQFERWVYYWENRVNPDGTFPDENAGYFNAGILDSNGKIVANSPKNLRVASNTQSWTNIGPKQSDLNNNSYPNFPQMGRLNAFLRIKHPSDTNLDVLLVGAPNGGVWKSTNNGNTWSPKLDVVAGIGITDIKTVPGTTTENYTTMPIYVSTGDYDGGNVKSIGVLKSTDGGESFNSTGLSYTIDQKKVTGDLVVFNANTVFVGADKIMKTTDGGATWTVAYDPGYSNLEIGRAAINWNEVMYTGNANDVYYTSDYTSDSNWTTITTPSGFGGKAAVTVDENGDFYIQKHVNVQQGAQPDPDTGQVKKFDKSNSTFSNVGNPPQGYNAQGGFNQALIVTNDIMISGEFNGTHSVDKGVNWYRSLNGYWSNPANEQAGTTSDGAYIHSDHHRMGKLDGVTNFWSVNDGGLSFISYPTLAPAAARTLTATSVPAITYKSSTVLVTQSYSVAINPSANDGAIMMANQDNDAFSKYGGTWYAVAAGDGIQSAIDYNDPKIRYVGNQNGWISQTNTGFNGQLNGNGNNVKIPGTGATSFYYPLEMDKKNPKILYGGGDDVYKIDATNAATDGSNGLTIAETNSGLGSITSIATQASAEGNAVMAASASAIKLLPPGTSSWINVSVAGITGGNITSVDFDGAGTPGAPYYATVSGYSAGNKVFKTTDGGSTWVNISGDLPNIVINEVLLKQGQSSEYLFLATELGVYYTTNGGTNWGKLGQGLPNVDIKDIEIHYTGDKLVAASFGRGLWEINIMNSTLSTTETLKQAEGISVYPNPANHKVHIDTPSGQYEYLMYNVVGGIVKRGVVENTAIDVSNLAPSVYIVRVFNDESSFSQKIIIE